MSRHASNHLQKLRDLSATVEIYEAARVGSVHKNHFGDDRYPRVRHTFPMPCIESR
jgi:hypothetical protein